MQAGHALLHCEVLHGSCAAGHPYVLPLTEHHPLHWSRSPLVRSTIPALLHSSDSLCSYHYKQPVPWCTILFFFNGNSLLLGGQRITMGRQDTELWPHCLKESFILEVSLSSLLLISCTYNNKSNDAHIALHTQLGQRWSSFLWASALSGGWYFSVIRNPSPGLFPAGGTANFSCCGTFSLKDIMKSSVNINFTKFINN